MPLLYQIRSEKLIQLARERFDPELSEAELKALNDSATSIDPKLPEDDAPRPAIRPEFVRWLATEREAAAYIDPKGLRVYGVTLAGYLDLQGSCIAVTLDFRKCVLNGEMNLQFAESRSIYLMGCTVEGIVRADGMEMHGHLFLRQSRFSCQVRLIGARITGNLECSGAKLEGKEAVALLADYVEVGGSVMLDGGFASSGAIRLPGAQIKGNLECSGARITGQPESLGAQPEGGDKLALVADGAQIDGSVYLREGFIASGIVRLPCVRIKGVLDCSSAKLEVEKGFALTADRAEIDGGVFLREGFTSSGTVRLLDAQIKGELDCSGSKLEVEKGDALVVAGAQVTGGLNCAGARLLVKEGNALLAYNAEITGNMLIGNGFEASGKISLHSARIGGVLVFFGASVGHVEGTNLAVTGDLQWMGIKVSSATYLDLSGARVRNLHDDRESWPPKDRLVVDDLVYEELSLHPRPTVEQLQASQFDPELPLDAGERIGWLMLQSPKWRFEPQPWMQLSNHLESKGDHEGAKHVLYRLRCLQTENRRFLPRQWAIAFAWLEEAPLRILYTITFAVLLGWIVFGYAGATGAIAPTEAEAYKAFAGKKPLPATYPSWNPFIYTLENAVPLAKLGQDDKWAPEHGFENKAPFTGYWFLMWFRWLLILFGWFQAAVLGAALLRRFKE